MILSKHHKSILPILAVLFVFAQVTLADTVKKRKKATADQEGHQQTVTNDDLACSFDKVYLSDDIIIGQEYPVKAKINIFNNSDIEKITEKYPVVLELYLRPIGAADSSGDIFIDSKEIPSLKGLKQGKSKKITFNSKLPRIIAPCYYQLLAVIDALDDVQEDNEDNNLAFSEEKTRGIQPDIDLTVAVNNTSLPLEFYTTQKETLSVTLQNNGNFIFGKKDSISMIVFLRPSSTGLLDNSQDVILDTIEKISLKDLREKHPKTIPLKVQIPADTPFNEYYSIGFYVDSENDFLETNEDNNLIFSDYDILVKDRTARLTADVVAYDFPVETIPGQAFQGTVYFKVTNVGQLITQSNTQAMPYVRFTQTVLQTIMDGENEEIVEEYIDYDVLTNGGTISLGLMRPGETRTFTALVTVPANTLPMDELTLSIGFDSESELSFITQSYFASMNAGLIDPSSIRNEPTLNKRRAK